MPDAVIDLSESLLGDNVPVKIGTSPDDRAECVDQLILACHFRFSDDILDFRQDVLDILLRWGDQKILPEIRVFHRPSLLHRDY